MDAGELDIMLKCFRRLHALSYSSFSRVETQTYVEMDDLIKSESNRPQDRLMVACVIFVVIMYV